MSDVTFNMTAKYDKNGTDLQFGTGSVGVDLTGDEMIDGVLTATSAAALAIPLGGVSTGGVCIIHNLDDTNYVTLGYDDTGFQSVMQILAGDFIKVYLDDLISAPYVQADTADCLIRYLIFEQ